MQRRWRTQPMEGHIFQPQPKSAEPVLNLLDKLLRQANGRRVCTSCLLPNLWLKRPYLYG